MAAARTDHEEAEARAAIWKYIYGFTEVAVMKCAIELGIPNILEKHAESGSAITLSQLSSALGCSPSILYGIMMFLTHCRMFKEMTTDQESSIAYIQTALSLLLMKNSLAPFILLMTNPVMLAAWHGLSKLVLPNGDSAFEASHGQDLWQHAASNPPINKLFNNAMACHARVTTSAGVEYYPPKFEGIGSLVDVGSGDVTTLRALVKAFPWIRGINFDLPHVISSAPHSDGVENAQGNFFQSIPNADAALIMWVLHDWDDDARVKILKNCKEAVPMGHWESDYCGGCG